MDKKEKIYTSVCQECRDNHWDWRHCKGFDSYQPADICYCFQQVMWLIEHSEAESWPRAVSGYTDNPEGHQPVPSAHAPFEGIRMAVAEIYDRLKTCRDAGEALEGEAVAGVPLGKLSGPAYWALRYVSGLRKDMPFKRWRTQQEKRAEERAKARLC